MRLDASIQGLHSVFSLSTYVGHIIILFHASLQRLFKPNIIIIGYVCVDHNIIIIITGMFPVGDTSCRTLIAVCVCVCPPTYS